MKTEVLQDTKNMVLNMLVLRKQIDEYLDVVASGKYFDQRQANRQMSKNLQGARQYKDYKGK